MDINEVVKVWICEIVASLFSSNKLLYAGYFGIVLRIACMLKMGVEVSGLNNISRKLPT